MRSASCVVLALLPSATRAAEPLTIRVQAFITEKHLDVSFVADPAAFPAGKTRITVTLTGPQGVVLEEKGLIPETPPAAGATALTIGPDGRGTLKIDGARVPPGNLALRVTARQMESAREAVAERALDSPLKPPWLGTREGLTEQVPAPWTPIVVAGDAVKPWGRTYRFARSLLPTEVVTREASVLAAPIRLVGQADGRPLVWESEPVTFTARTPAVVSLTGSARSANLTLTGAATIEYDGMVRVDLALTPKSGKATVQDLVLEVPLKPEHARYLYHFPGRWGSVDNSGFLPQQGWAHAFKPFVWLGDEDRGFSWFCESDRDWYPADPNRALTIERTEKAVLLRCHLVDQPRELSAPLRYTFGFEATPCKRPEKTVWDYRLVHDGSYGLETRPATLSGTIAYPSTGHIRAEEGTFECWYRPAYGTERATPVAERKHQANRGLFLLRWEGDIGTGSNCGFYWNYVAQGFVAFSRKDGKVTHYQEAPFDWKAGEWHHVAMTWSDQIRIYVDGKLLSEKPNQGFFPYPVERARLVIGGDRPSASIDELRILSVARAPAAAPAQYAPDAQTLLLDHFEDYGQAGVKTAGQPDADVGFGPGRFGRGGIWEGDLGMTQLEWLARQGVRTVCFHEHWSPYQSYPYVTEENRPKLKSLADACRKQRVSLLLYMSRQFADNTPEWELYSDEALQEPRGGPYTREPKQKAYNVCWNNAWQDFCLAHLAKMLDELAFDGWYLDGPEWPMPCANRHHGCGYVAADGSVHPTYDLFATREFMKRLYVLTRQRRPQGQLNVHNSTVMVIPTLGWGTSSWGGEQIDAIKPPVRTLDVLPLDAFRTEFMGRQWGVPSEFLVYDGAPYYAKDVLAYTLLHGVIIRPFAPDMLARISALWRVYDAFPFRDARMYPYWDSGGVFACAPEGVYATAYERPGEGLLLFVSNLGDRDAEATVTLNTAKLGWRTRPKAWDALTGETVALEHGALRMPLGSWKYRVLRAAPAR